MSEYAASGASERRTSTVELLWDLVFVFAITQVTALRVGLLVPAGFIFISGLALPGVGLCVVLTGASDA